MHVCEDEKEGVWSRNRKCACMYARMKRRESGLEIEE